MQWIIFLSLLQLIILGNEHYFTNAKPIIGLNIQQENGTNYSFVVTLVARGNVLLAENIFCTGTLIFSSFVITTEHCVQDIPAQGFQILIGSTNIHLAIAYYSLWSLSYGQWVQMRQQRARYRTNDIALIKLSQSVPVNIFPATIGLTQNRDLFGYNATIAGWGRTNTGQLPENMHTASVTIINSKDCADLAMRLEGVHSFVTHAEICSKANPYIQLESGDSGGPLLLGNIIVGVNLGQYPELNSVFHPDKANIHASIYFYRNFIESTTEM